ncbi:MULTISPECIES: phosphatase PAP2 family protein [unclassified Francisella]|uniref:phosphatase PAP2 family protein n=1 Tax=unclassified Francisella TaxID=2610885 RepID=UPI002E311EBA|nr:MULTISPECIES: phosphatase PAP2 family protein [unclassified Francisella]MED7818695.1 phosphatase PAP2 family protein [Francisella sp. 19S2-4]MED7829588.1 phosphatase PAP2 family protein [Francisella sp. 19S2-10]
MKKIIISISLAVFACECVFASTNYGFLSKDKLPNSYKLLPAPPIMQLDSDGKNYPAFAQDKAISQKLFDDENQVYFNGKPIPKERLQEAIDDNNKSTEYFLKIFIDPMVGINDEDKRKIKEVVKDIVTNVVLDSANSTAAAKEKYHRARPYYYEKSSCVGEDSSSKKRELSYPSGHSIRGITVARVLAEILPNKYREQLLHRGMEYGDSRVICGDHWQSDIEASRVLSGFVMNALEQNNQYKVSVKQAKQKVKKILDQK